MVRTQGSLAPCALQSRNAQTINMHVYARLAFGMLRAYNHVVNQTYYRGTHRSANPQADTNVPHYEALYARKDCYLGGYACGSFWRTYLYGATVYRALDGRFRANKRMILASVCRPDRGSNERQTPSQRVSLIGV